MITAYVYDGDLRVEANKNGKNYWYEYIKEMNEQLGLSAKEIPSKSLEDKALLNDVMILFIGDIPESRITAKIKANLNEWVKNGGVLIGFNTVGLDEIFGNLCDSVITQPENDWTISGISPLMMIH